MPERLLQLYYSFTQVLPTFHSRSFVPEMYPLFQFYSISTPVLLKFHFFAVLYFPGWPGFLLPFDPCMTFFFMFFVVFFCWCFAII